MIQLNHMALASGATYVAQGITSNIKQLTRLVKEGIEHEGFSLINVFSPCVTYDKKRTYAWYKEHLTDLDALEGYNPSDWSQAMNTVHEHGEMVVGLIYREEKPSFEAQLPQRPLPGRTKAEALQSVLISEFK